MKTVQSTEQWPILRKKSLLFNEDWMTFGKSFCDSICLDSSFSIHPEYHVGMTFKRHSLSHFSKYILGYTHTHLQITRLLLFFKKNNEIEKHTDNQVHVARRMEGMDQLVSLAPVISYFALCYIFAHIL